MIPAVIAPALPAMGDDAIRRVRMAEAIMGCQPQIDMPTMHLIHAGMYARTIRIPAGAVITGALIKRATTLIVHGTCTVYIGDGTMDLEGYNVIPASAGRKQIFIAHTDTYLTMIFPTDALTVADAEDEFTDEAHLLMSRKHPGADAIQITGE